MNSFFSTASIHRFEHIMKEHLSKLLSRLDVPNQVVKIHDVFKAAASDIITMYAFDNAFHFLDMPDYGESYFEATHKFFLLTHVCLFIPPLYPLIQNSPAWLLKLVLPGLSPVRDRQNVSPASHSHPIHYTLNILTRTKLSGGWTKSTQCAKTPTRKSQNRPSSAAS